MVREMSELTIARYDIAECKNMPKTRPTIRVSDDASLVRLDSDSIECESVSVRYSAECEEDVRIVDSLMA